MGLWQWLTGAGWAHRDGASDPASAEPGSGRPADTPAPPAGGSVRSATGPTPPVRQGWSSAPVMPRAVVQTSLLSDSARFERSLTTRQNPGFLRPLGHAVSSAAPTGVIHGLIEPAGAPVAIQGARPLPAPAGPAPLRVQRSAPRPAPRPPLIVAAPQAEARRMPVVPAPAGRAVQRRLLPTSAQADVDPPHVDQPHVDQPHVDQPHVEQPDGASPQPWPEALEPSSPGPAVPQAPSAPRDAGGPLAEVATEGGDPYPDHAPADGGGAAVGTDAGAPPTPQPAVPAPTDPATGPEAGLPGWVEQIPDSAGSDAQTLGSGSAPMPATPAGQDGGPAAPGPRPAAPRPPSRSDAPGAPADRPPTLGSGTAGRSAESTVARMPADGAVRTSQGAPTPAGPPAEGPVPSSSPVPDAVGADVDLPAEPSTRGESARSDSGSSEVPTLGERPGLGAVSRMAEAPGQATAGRAGTTRPEPTGPAGPDLSPTRLAGLGAPMPGLPASASTANVQRAVSPEAVVQALRSARTESSSAGAPAAGPGSVSGPVPPAGPSAPSPPARSSGPAPSDGADRHTSARDTAPPEQGNADAGGPMAPSGEAPQSRGLPEGHDPSDWSQSPAAGDGGSGAGPLPLQPWPPDPLLESGPPLPTVQLAPWRGLTPAEWTRADPLGEPGPARSATSGPAPASAAGPAARPAQRSRVGSPPTAVGEAAGPGVGGRTVGVQRFGGLPHLPSRPTHRTGSTVQGAPAAAGSTGAPGTVEAPSAAGASGAAGAPRAATSAGPLRAGSAELAWYSGQPEYSSAVQRTTAAPHAPGLTSGAPQGAGPHGPDRDGWSSGHTGRTQPPGAARPPGAAQPAWPSAPADDAIGQASGAEPDPAGLGGGWQALGDARDSLAGFALPDLPTPPPIGGPAPLQRVAARPVAATGPQPSSPGRGTAARPTGERVVARALSAGSPSRSSAVGPAGGGGGTPAPGGGLAAPTTVSRDPDSAAVGPGAGPRGWSASAGPPTMVPAATAGGSGGLGTVQRRPVGPVRADLPAAPGSSAAASGGTRLRTAGDAAVAMGIAQRLPDGSVTFAAPDAATGAAPPASLGGGPTPSTHVVQRQEETEQRGAQATEPAAGEAGLTEPEPSPAESLASQAMKMYPIIARQLRMELSRERDRHGNRSGFGH